MILLQLSNAIHVGVRMIMATPIQRIQMFGYGALAGLGVFGWEQALALVWSQKALTAPQLGCFALIYMALGSVILGTLALFSRQPSVLVWLSWTVWMSLLCEGD